MSSKFWWSIQFTLFFQRIHGLSSFTIQKNKPIHSWFLTIFSFLQLILLVGSTAWSIYMIIAKDSIKHFFDSGYLWGVIIIFELIVSNIFYILMIIHCEYNKIDRMTYLELICEMDVELFEHFDVQPNYKKQRWFGLFMALSVMLYFQMLRIIAIGYFTNANMVSIESMILINCYILEQVSVSIESIAYIVQIKIIAERFYLIEKIQQHIVVNQDQIDLVDYTQKVSILFKSFRKLCNAIVNINSKSGILLVFQYAHDFTLTTSQCYVIFWIFIDNPGDDRYVYIVNIFIWMIHNASKIFATCFLPDYACDQVRQN